MLTRTLPALLLALALGLATTACTEEPATAPLPGADAGGDALADATGGDAGADPGAGVDVGVLIVSCASYCSTIQAACTGVHAQYGSEAECLAVCKDGAAWPPGAPGSSSGDTLACRVYHAAAAQAQDPATHCAHAGPTGGDVCGTWCDNYCRLADRLCVDANAIAFDPDCASACAALDDDGPAKAAAGDHVQCRINHLMLAGIGAPATHCPHAAPGGGGVCVDEDPTCDAYCDEIMDACTGQNAQYPDRGTCLDVCESVAAWPLGTGDDNEGNTVGCRITHARLAGLNPDAPGQHCEHAGPTGGDVCGSWCDNYCALTQQYCIGADQLYATDDACTLSCLTFATSGSAGDTVGDTLQCRLTEVLTAATEGPGDHCVEAGPDATARCVPYDPAPTCAEYCATVQAACGEGDSPTAQYASTAACEARCALMTPGTGADTDVNTLGCRATHAAQAAQALAADPAADVSQACAAAGASGGNTCGSWCDNYCDLAAFSCSGGNALYASEAACRKACSALPVGGAPGDLSGDSVQCRIEHLGLPAQQDPGLSCAAASLLGGMTCVDESPSCEAYCTSIQAACGSAGQSTSQYDSKAACLDYCQGWAKLPLGNTIDVVGNTVGCRTYHSRVALLSGADTHCPHAGPSGGNVCGSYCTNYCWLASQNCKDVNALYAGDAACNDACALVDQTGTPGDATGDSVQCRITRLGLAGANGGADAAAECSYAAAAATQICVGEVIEPPKEPTCADYCTVVTANCSGDDAQYASFEACVTYCADWAQLPLGDLGDQTGNTIGCRMTHANLAADPELAPEHCAHAGPTGGNVCGVWCDNYCHLALTNCTDEATLFGDLGSCAAACSALSADGKPGDTAGDSVQCRLYHAALAGSAGLGSALQYCPNASPEGGEVCVLGGGAAVYASVKGVFQQSCSPCHAGTEPGTCQGGACFASFYEDALLPSYYCPGKTKGECALTRIKDGSMPLAIPPGAVPTEQQQDLLQAWIEAGLPEQ